ncbi:MAG: hypothetical protein IT208_03280 [Chthonomonadales bacterium]|nr:hypothetical protein [Chthonomonadales bacterium]
MARNAALLGALLVLVLVSLPASSRGARVMLEGAHYRLRRGMVEGGSDSVTPYPRNGPPAPTASR